MIRTALFASLIALSTTLPTMAQETPKVDFKDPAVKAQLDDYFGDWVAHHPEIIYKAVQGYVEAEQQKSLPQTADFLARANELIAGDAPHDGADLSSAKLVFVEFFDFNCPYCHELHKDIAKLKAANPDIAFVYRDFPILTTNQPVDFSREAAETGRAAMKQGKYDALADGLFTLPSHGIDEEGIMRVAKAAGLDMDALMRDRVSQEAKDGVEKTFQQARSLKISGTPFIFLYSPEYKKGTVIGGYAPAEQIQPAIDALKKGQDVQ